MPHLDDGAYVLTWRVISADSHPVHGAFTFIVGSSSVNAQGLATKLESKGNGQRAVGVIFAIARGDRIRRHRAVDRRDGVRGRYPAPRPAPLAADALVWIGWVTLFLATIAGVLLQGPYAAALPLSEVFHTAVIRAVLHTRYGHLARNSAGAPDRSAAVAVRGSQAVDAALVVVGPRGSAGPRDCRNARPRRSRGHRNVHRLRDPARHVARDRDERVARRLGGTRARGDRSRSGCAANRRPFLARRVVERARDHRVRSVRGLAPGRVVSRRVPRHELRTHPPREDRRVRRAARARSLEPAHRSRAPSGHAQRRSHDRGGPGEPGRDCARRSRGQAAALVGRRRAPVRHHDPRDHRDARERAARAQRVCRSRTRPSSVRRRCSST